MARSRLYERARHTRPAVFSSRANCRLVERIRRNSLVDTYSNSRGSSNLHKSAVISSELDPTNHPPIHGIPLRHAWNRGNPRPPSNISNNTDTRFNHNLIRDRSRSTTSIAPNLDDLKKLDRFIYIRRSRVCVIERVFNVEHPPISLHFSPLDILFESFSSIFRFNIFTKMCNRLLSIENWRPPPIIAPIFETSSRYSILFVCVDKKNFIAREFSRFGGFFFVFVTGE